MGRVTIKDIAREAGVSISTVSNALNGVDVLKPATREHILEVAKRLNYVPDINGKNLKAKSKKVIGFFINSLKGTFFSAVADSMYRECIKKGYDLNIFMTSGSRSAINNIIGQSMDGCVIFSSDVNEEGVAQIINQGIPTVFLDRNIVDEKISSVLFDSENDGKIVADYLVKNNITRVACVQGIMSHHDGQDRFKGFAERLKEAGVTISEDYILEGEFERERAYKSTKEFLTKELELPEVIFAENDLSAIGAMDALKEAGYSVPEDVKVIGVDDTELASFYSPNITTVRTGYAEIGPRTIDKLLKMINDGEKGECIRFSGSLIIRESTRGIDNK